MIPKTNVGYGNLYVKDISITVFIRYYFLFKNIVRTTVGPTLSTRGLIVLGSPNLRSDAWESLLVKDSITFFVLQRSSIRTFYLISFVRTTVGPTLHVD